MTRYREIYCNNCKKILGRYNTKYYSESKIGEVIRTNHSLHVREGHDLEQRLTQEKPDHGN